MADLAQKAESKGITVFTPFLDLRERELAVQAVAGLPVTATPFGGYASAERVMLAFSCYGQTEPDDFPLLSLDYTVHGAFDHRDVLGSILGLGLQRDRVGDILLFEGGFRVFVSEKIADFLLDQLTRVGREAVHYTPGAGDGLDLGPRYEAHTDTVASTRLDGIVAAVAACSRGDATGWIERGLVSVNHLVVTKATTQIDAGDVLSVRGKGKFRIDDLSGLSKKGRVILKYSKYL